MKAQSTKAVLVGAFACLVLLTAGVVPAGAAGTNSGTSGPTLLALLAAKQQVEGARSVTVTGSVQQVTTTYRVHLTLFSNGDSDGTISIGNPSAAIVISGSYYYIEGSAGFWTKVFGQVPSYSKKLAQEWFALRRSSVTGIGANISLQHLQQGFASSPTQFEILGTTTIGRTPVIHVHLESAGELYVATQAPNFPVAYKGMNELNLVFSDWNSGSAPKAPTGLIIYTGQP